MSDQKPYATQEPFFTDQQAAEVLKGVKQHHLFHTKEMHDHECSNPAKFAQTINDELNRFAGGYINQPLIGEKPIKDLVTELCKDVSHDPKTPGAGGGFSLPNILKR